MTATEAPNTATTTELSGPPEVGSPLVADDGISLNDLDSADATAGSQPVETQQQPEATQQPEQAQETAATAQADPDAARRQELIEQFAKEYKISPTDPNYAGMLKRLADKELHIEKLKAGQQQSQATETKTPSDQLTEFERQLLGAKPKEGHPPEKPPEAPQEQTAVPASAAANLQLGDAGDAWKTPEEAYTALDQAWAAGDPKKVSDVSFAIFKRQALEFVPAIVQSMLQQALGEDFPVVLPEITKTVHARRDQEDTEFAISQLSSVPDYTEVAKLWEPEGDGEMEAFGDKFKRTALNRIIAANPYILDIETKPKPDMDPRAAARLTKMNQLRAVYQIWKAEQAQKNAIDPKKAQELVEAGRKVEQRSASDATRQSLNAGSGATTAQGQQPTPRNYVQELIANRRSEQGVSLNDI